MSVSWQNRMRGRSLVAQSAKLKGGNKKNALKLRLNELTDTELHLKVWHV